MRTQSQTTDRQSVSEASERAKRERHIRTTTVAITRSMRECATDAKRGKMRHGRARGLRERDASGANGAT